MLERIIIEKNWLTAVDTGTQTVTKTDAARFAWENHRKFMGIKPHHLDIYVYGCESRVYTQFELKYGKNGTNTGQDTTIALLTQRGIPTGVYNTVIGVYEHVRDAGLTLHGNAANIAAECEMRWRAADEAARGKVVVKKSYNPRKAKAAPSKIRASERVRARVGF